MEWRNVPRPGRRGTVAETGEVELRMLVDTRHQAETFNQSMECVGWEQSRYICMLFPAFVPSLLEEYNIVNFRGEACLVSSIDCWRPAVDLPKFAAYSILDD